MFQHCKTPTSHRTKANVQQLFSNIACYCELAVHLFFFEKHQSCVCSTATLSHRFKAFTPPFCRQNRFRHVPPENSAKIFFGRALNRPRSPEVRKPLACFLVLFARRKKNVKTSPLQGASRFCKPRNSAPQPQLRTATIKTFSKGSFEVLQTSNQRTKITYSYKPN